MKINFLSDLHLESVQLPESLLAKTYVPTGDVVLLIGDITNARNMGHVEKHFGTSTKPVLYVPGNHEYYGGDWDSHVDRMCKFYHTKDSPIKVMDDDYIQIGDVHFLGSTFWSNISETDKPDAERYIADFRFNPLTGQPVIQNMTVDKQRQAHQLSVQWLDLMLGNIRKKDANAKIVVFTHFPPSWKAQEERFKSSGLSSYFYSENDYLIEKYQPNYWLYGHTHGNLSWDHGITKIRSNQCGYRSENTYLTYDQHAEIEL